MTSGCAKAAAYGLVAGMRLADARALCPDVITEDYNSTADHADLHHLALWARRYSPLTAIDHEFYGIWLDVAGAEHLFGGVRELLADCAKRLHRSHLRAVIAAAPNCGAAWALAHYGQPSQRVITAPKSAANQLDATAYTISRARLRHYLARLPIAALRIDTDVADHMQQAGLRVIDDIIGLARAPLAARFGTDVLLRLDQALGNEDEIFTPVSPPQPRYVCRQFAEPISTSDDVKAMIDYLATETATLLEQTGLATRRLRLGWQLVDEMVFTYDVHLSRPSRDVALFHRLLANASDRINAEFGLEMGWMEALDCSPLAPIETIYRAWLDRSKMAQQHVMLMPALLTGLWLVLAMVQWYVCPQKIVGSLRLHNHLNCPTQNIYLMGLAKKLAGLVILYVLLPRRGLFGCLHIRSRLT